MSRPTVPASIPGLLIERETPVTFVREVETAEHAGRSGCVVFRPVATVTYLGEHSSHEGVVLVLGIRGWASIPLDFLGVPLDNRTARAHVAWWLVGRTTVEVLRACGLDLIEWEGIQNAAAFGLNMSDASIDALRRVVLHIAGLEDTVPRSCRNCLHGRTNGPHENPVGFVFCENPYFVDSKWVADNVPGGLDPNVMRPPTGCRGWSPGGANSKNVDSKNVEVKS